jgi:hypothetical protein
LKDARCWRKSSGFREYERSEMPKKLEEKKLTETEKERGYLRAGGSLKAGKMKRGYG